MRYPNRRTLAMIALGLALPTLPGAAQDADVLLDPPAIENNDLTFRATGMDPAAPRRLTLWRSEGSMFRRLASARSDSRGSFDFGEQPILPSEGSFHVTREGRRPDGSRPTRILLPVPSPVILSSGVDPNEIEIAPALFAGEIQVRDAANGQLLLRHAIDATATGRWTLDFAQAGISSRSGVVSIDHLLPDGRRSRSILWRLADP